jgi:diguanylate cyclase (GGDEF)-like protein/PAS domain S-box-containing protein
VQLALQGDRSSFEGHLVRRGQDVYFQAHVVPSRNPQGEVSGFYVMTFDITAVREAERARTRSENLLRQITDNLPALIAYVDADQRFRFANGTYRTWLGVEPQEVAGRTVREVVGDRFYEPRRAYLERALRGERVDFETDAETLGVTRHTRVSYIPDLGDDGQVRGIFTLTSDISDLKRVEQQLQALARQDTLTGLLNRLAFNERLATALARGARHQTAVALAFLDVDRFKGINDTYGHAAGDAVLRAFAQRLVACVRAVDTVARLGGDEFVVILEDLHDTAHLPAIAEKIIREVAEPVTVDGVEVHVSTSVGIAVQRPAGAATDAEALLARADEALYAAKAGGRNTWRVVGDEPPA